MLKEELSERILERFPWTSEYNKSAAKHRMPAYLIGDGWFKLVWSMLEEFEQVFEQKDAKVDIEYVKIKEKYGGLRMYVISSFPEVIRSILTKYEERSYEICSECGNNGSLHYQGDWLNTLCNFCTKEQNYIGYKEKLFVPNGDCIICGNRDAYYSDRAMSWNDYCFPCSVKHNAAETAHFLYEQKLME